MRKKNIARHIVHDCASVVADQLNCLFPVLLSEMHTMRLFPTINITHMTLTKSELTSLVLETER